MRVAGCRGLRKVCGRALAKMRRLAEKEGGVFGRDAWAGMSRAGEGAGGAAGCGGMRAWGRAGLAELAAGCGATGKAAHQKFSAKVTRVVSFCRRSLPAIFPSRECSCRLFTALGFCFRN